MKRQVHYIIYVILLCLSLILAAQNKLEDEQAAEKQEERFETKLKLGETLFVSTENGNVVVLATTREGDNIDVSEGASACASIKVKKGGGKEIMVFSEKDDQLETTTFDRDGDGLPETLLRKHEGRVISKESIEYNFVKPEK